MAILVGTAAFAAPTKFSISGTVADASDGSPMIGVVISVGEDYLWGVSGLDGTFRVDNVQPGEYRIKASCLGYVDWVQDISVKDDMEGLAIVLQVNSLALKEVVVTAQRSDAASTTHTLGRDALNHLQMSGVSDMSALLPGGKTINPDLTTASQFSLRSGGVSGGNAAFSTAVEVDGVRLGNNAGFGELSGVDTRSVAVDNVESVEVITGVPSAEYGDLGSGMVRIHTKKGRTPLNVTFSVNPRTYQTSASKGIDLGDDRGVLNVSAEWARATKKLSSPYESYARRGMSFAYSNTFAKVLRFEAGVTGNLGGMNSEDDPDAFSGAWTKGRDNVLRANTALTWQLGKDWITNLKFDASVNYSDNLSHIHDYYSFASMQPAVHSEQEGYALAQRLPLTYFTDQITDSRELDAAASLKYGWNHNWGSIKSKFKAGVQWKTSGNVGLGEYYQDPSVASNGYRPRPYTDYPFMHNFSGYAEDDLSLPLGKTTIQLTAGLRAENVYIKGTQYDNMNTLSPRFNARWKLFDALSVRGGWGITEKLPSFHILYPKQEYRDIQTFGFSHGDGVTSSYIYYTQPFTVRYNPELRWQRNSNSELGLDAEVGGFKIGVVAFRNVTSLPYKITSLFTPFSYNLLQIPAGFSIPDNPQVKVDAQTGSAYVRPEGDYWTPMDIRVTDRTFVNTTMQDNGADIVRSGVEITVDCPEIKPLRTSLRFDASYNHTSTVDDTPAYVYNKGWSHTTLPNRSYQYVGIYANGGNSTTMVNGKITNSLDANVTSITHIPEARLVVTCRLEMSLLKRSLNLPAGDKTALWPVSYMDLDGNIHEFTATQASDPEFEHLILHPSNDYLFDLDGYGPYASANLSITKEVGEHVSLSFFANNFTASRPTVYSLATGVGVIFTPAFYYGLTCRLKF